MQMVISHISSLFNSASWATADQTLRVALKQVLRAHALAFCQWSYFANSLTCALFLIEYDWGIFQKGPGQACCNYQLIQRAVASQFIYFWLAYYQPMGHIGIMILNWIYFVFSLQTWIVLFARLHHWFLTSL